MNAGTVMAMPMSRLTNPTGHNWTVKQAMAKVIFEPPRKPLTPVLVKILSRVPVTVKRFSPYDLLLGRANI
jgi:hypothetical protein